MLVYESATGLKWHQVQSGIAVQAEDAHRKLEKEAEEERRYLPCSICKGDL